jgi:hypothetical protein
MHFDPAERPDARHVASFGTWLELGRSVAKGSRALTILQPRLAAATSGLEVTQGTERGAPVRSGPRGLDEGGARSDRRRASMRASSEEQSNPLIGFKPLSVFSLEQTHRRRARRQVRWNRGVAPEQGPRDSLPWPRRTFGSTFHPSAAFRTGRSTSASWNILRLQTGSLLLQRRHEHRRSTADRLIPVGSAQRKAALGDRSR